jgi:anionic cell wall polymer biosynthesis LytR-Cps2A-Psr (LCP) family protein
MIAGKLLYGVVCLFAAVLLVVAGYAHKVVGLVNETEKGIAISGSPTIGAMNILVMGLESRTNYEGQTLSAGLLAAMHAGSVEGVNDEGVGGQDTDTLILIHIFAGGKRAVGFSIPRDDVVNYPHATYDGLTEGKIDAAYAYAYDQSLGQTYGSNMTQAQRYLDANQAGQLFEVQTVESFTGVHIDHFIESNIIGFYELAQQSAGSRSASGRPRLRTASRLGRT